MPRAGQSARSGPFKALRFLTSSMITSQRAMSKRAAGCSQVAELPLQHGERGDRRGLGAQDAWPQTHRREARGERRGLLGIGKSTLGPDEHGDRRDRSRYVLDAYRAGGREQQARAASTLPEEVSERK